MKERDARKARSAISGNIIKMKVRKTSEDKQVCQQLSSAKPGLSLSVMICLPQREINRKQLLNFLNNR